MAWGAFAPFHPKLPTDVIVPQNNTLLFAHTGGRACRCTSFQTDRPESHWKSHHENAHRQLLGKGVVLATVRGGVITHFNVLATSERI